MKICYWHSNSNADAEVLRVGPLVYIGYIQTPRLIEDSDTPYLAIFSSEGAARDIGFFSTIEEAKVFIENKARKSGYRILTEREANLL